MSDVIEDKIAHKMDYELVKQGTGVTSPIDAESFSLFDLAEYCFSKAPEYFQKRGVKCAIRKGKVDIVEMGHVKGIDVKEILLCEEDMNIVGDEEGGTWK